MLGELASQWQQMMVFLQRVEQETVSSQNMTNAKENTNRTRIDAAGSRLQLKDGERRQKNWSGSTPLGGFAREVAARLGCIDPKHEAGTLRATEAWTDFRHANDDKYVALDRVALASATEGAARSTVLKVTPVEPSHRFVAWQALVDGHAPKSSNEPAIALQPIHATSKRCKDAKELDERPTAWSLRVAKYEHEFKAIDEAQNTFVVRDMMPKDIKREFLMGLRNHGKTGDHHQRNDVRRRTSTNGPGKRWYARCDKDTESSGHEQRLVTRRRPFHCWETVQSRQGSREARTKQIRDVASWKRS